MATRAPKPHSKPQAEDPATDKAAPARFCQVCGIRISSYNPGPNCWQHTMGYPWRGPTAKPKF